jgi:hypothetical protein
MLKSYCFAAAILALAAMPAIADNDCGPAPIGPAIPAASDLSGKTIEASRAEVLAAYHQVKAYQGALQPFRACLKTQSDANKAALLEAQGKADKDKIASVQQSMEDLQKIYDGTVDTETQIANDFNALHMADCVNDTDPKICPKKQ